MSQFVSTNPLFYLNSTGYRNHQQFEPQQPDYSLLQLPFKDKKFVVIGRGHNATDLRSKIASAGGYVTSIPFADFIVIIRGEFPTAFEKAAIDQAVKSRNVRVINETQLNEMMISCSNWKIG